MYFRSIFCNFSVIFPHFRGLDRGGEFCNFSPFFGDSRPGGFRGSVRGKTTRKYSTNVSAGKIRKIHSSPECTKIAHRLSLAIFAADEGIAGNSTARTIFTHFIRRRNRGSLAIFFAEEIAHLGASKDRAIFLGAVKIAAKPQRIARFWCTQILTN